MTIERLGKYEVRGILGKGAMGTVYEGWDPDISRKVAIKTVARPEAGDSEAQEQLARFRREAQAAGRLSHPNIVGVFDYSEAGDLAYIVMEYVDGRTLKSVLDRGERMSLPVVRQIMTDTLAALAYSHSHGVVHRDIKPGNVILVGTSGQAKLADFGIARLESSELTQVGTIMGTPAYMSPEQYLGEAVDQRTDLYSAGVLLFQLLTGERPFEGSMSTIMHKALHTAAPKPSELSVTAPVALDAVVARAMARRPDERFATAAAFSDAMRAALDGKQAQPDADATLIQAPHGDAPTTRAGATQDGADRAHSPAPSLSPRAPAPVARRSRAPVVVGAALVALAAGGVGAWIALHNGAAPEAETLVADARPEPTRALPPAQTGKPAPDLPPPDLPAPDLPAPRLTVRDEPPPPPPPPLPGITAPAAPEIVEPKPVTEATAKPETAQAVAPTDRTPPPAPVPPPRVEPPSAPAAPPAPAAAAATATDAAPPVVTPPPPVPTTSAAPPVAPPPGEAPPIEAPQAAAPAQQAAAGVSPEAMRTAVATVLRRARCAVVAGGVAASGEIGLRGIVGDGAPLQELLGRVHEAAPVAAVDSALTVATGPYCGVFDLLQSLGATVGGAAVGLKNGRTSLVEDETIEIHVTSPATAFLQVDYLSSDGSVLHVHMAAPGGPAKAEETFVPGAVAPPFGTDLVVAIRSSVPLFPKKKAIAERIDAYVGQLGAAIDAARAHHAEISASVLVVQTRAK